MMTRRLIATAALLATAGLGAPAYAQQNIRLTAAAGHPPGVQSAPPDGAWTYRWLPARHRRE